MVFEDKPIEQDDTFPPSLGKNVSLKHKEMKIYPFRYFMIQFMGWEGEMGQNGERDSMNFVFEI